MGMPTLVLGDFDLTDWAGVRFNTSVIAEGTSRGGPVSIDVAVQSWLQDGSVVLTQGYDNRTVTLRVRLRGPDLVDLADCEAALVAELGKPNLLTWTPADGLAPASVFEVVTSQMVEAPGPDGDLAEQVQFPWRTYNLSLTCKAAVFSVDEVVVEGQPLGTTTSSVDTCASNSGWTGFIDGVPATVTNASGANKVSTVATGIKTLALVKDFTATDTSALRTLRVEWAGVPYWASGLKVYRNGVALPQALLVGGASSMLSYFAVGADTLGSLRFEWTSDGTNDFQVADVTLADGLPPLGSGRQSALSADVYGSMRTPGTLEVASETAPLGTCLLYAWRDAPDALGYNPAMSLFAPGHINYVTDSAMVSGGRTALDPSFPKPYFIPKQMLPTGRFLIMARLASTSGTTVGRLSLTASTDNVSSSASLVVESPTLSMSTTYDLVNIGRITLPVADLDPSSTGTVRLSVTEEIDSGAHISIDELWLFHRSIGALLRVECGTNNRLWVLPPTVTEPRQRVLVGESSLADAAHPTGGPLSWDFPQFSPPSVNVFAMTTTASDAVVALRYTPAWHTHAAL